MNTQRLFSLVRYKTSKILRKELCHAPFVQRSLVSQSQPHQVVDAHHDSHHGHDHHGEVVNEPGGYLFGHPVSVVYFSFFFFSFFFSFFFFLQLFILF